MNKIKVSKTSASGAGKWDSNPEPNKRPTHCQRSLATAAALKYGPWCKAAMMGIAHTRNTLMCIKQV